MQGSACAALLKCMHASAIDDIMLGVRHEGRCGGTALLAGLSARVCALLSMLCQQGCGAACVGASGLSGFIAHATQHSDLQHKQGMLGARAWLPGLCAGVPSSCACTKPAPAGGVRTHAHAHVCSPSVCACTKKNAFAYKGKLRAPRGSQHARTHGCLYVYSQAGGSALLCRPPTQPPQARTRTQAAHSAHPIMRR